VKPPKCRSSPRTPWFFRLAQKIDGSTEGTEFTDEPEECTAEMEPTQRKRSIGSNVFSAPSSASAVSSEKPLKCHSSPRSPWFFRLAKKIDGTTKGTEFTDEPEECTAEMEPTQRKRSAGSNVSSAPSSASAVSSEKPLKCHSSPRPPRPVVFPMGQENRWNHGGYRVYG